MTSRREFVRYSALGGSALVLGVRWDGENGRIAKANARFAPNDWIAIEDSGRIVLTIGKQEMGQGVRTSLAMILADELDADFSTVQLVQASPGPAFTRLGTGGSWSIGGSWRVLREAGATARAMLLTAAAARWGVDAATCHTERSAVHHAATGRQIRYADLVADAARLPVPSNVRPKTADQRRIVGTRQRRLDAPSIVDGSARFGIDVRVPGMLFACILRPPVPGATVTRIDSAAALGVSGVRSVTPISAGVAVVAEKTWPALKGRARLNVTWNEGPNRSFNSADHWQALERGGREAGVITRQEGTAPASLTGAQVLESTYHYPFAAHAPLEPMNCTAHVHDGRCEIWAPTQAPNALQSRVARLLGLTSADVHVTPTLIGGGFGRRLAVDYALEAAELSREIKAPVQVLWTRDDDMRHGHFQNASVHYMSGAVDAAGRALAWRHKKVASLHNLSGPPTADELKDAAAYFQDSSWGAYDIPYAIPSIETSYVRVDVPFRIGPWRAVYSPPSTFARECFIDELAGAAGTDPLEFRLQLLSGAAASVKAGSLTINRARLRHVLEQVRERSGWGTPLPAGRARGVACNVYDAETHVAYVAEVSVPERPRPDYLPFVVHRVTCVIDCGVVINPLGIEQQVESGIAWALSNMKGEITFRDGRAEQSNFRDFQVLRMSETPVIETYIVPSHGEQPFGVGEPPVPPLIPAVLNALFAATGRRIRRLPLRAADFA
ncbi:MAG: molybdopterin cofactor-binding domain-containing protein [Gemmatimonadota bacterium]